MHMILFPMMYTNACVDNDPITQCECAYSSCILSVTDRIIFPDDSFKTRSATFSFIIRIVPFTLAVCKYVIE